MPKGYWKPLTKAQEQKIKDEFLLKPLKSLARELKISDSRINRFLAKHGLVIPRHLIEQRKRDSQKKKGDVPPNKGKRQTDYMTPEAIERTKATRFKKGQIPHNVNKQGDGAIVLRKHKNQTPYKYIRISLGVWELYHHFIWKKHNGTIPKNHVVAFKDGNTENVIIENLELITMAENMLRNSKHKFPKEIVPSMLLLKQLENKLNQIQNG